MYNVRSISKERLEYAQDIVIDLEVMDEEVRSIGEWRCRGMKERLATSDRHRDANGLSPNERLAS
jgi:hypothetical protein